MGPPPASSISTCISNSDRAPCPGECLYKRRTFNLPRMFPMLNLILKAAKCCLVVSLVRLLTTAFGVEFGVSRQYLRLLEWVLRRGEERIVRCESEQRMQQAALEADEEDDFGGEQTGASRRPAGCKLAVATAAARPPTELNLAPAKEVCFNGGLSSESVSSEPLVADAKRNRRIGVTLVESGAGSSPREACNRHASGKPAPSRVLLKSEADQQRRRRVSTPDGPPVFLLDDDDDDDDNDDDDDDDNDHGDGTSGCGNASRTAELFGPAACLSQHEGRKHEFHLEDAVKFVVRGISAIIDDEVTKRFTREQLKTWNLLTRNNAKNYQFMSGSLGLWWLTGLMIRYTILVPLRIMFTLTGFAWLVTSMPLVGLIPHKLLRIKLYQLVSLMAFRMLSCGINSRLKFHNRQFRAPTGSICVANHTSPLDVVLLASDNCYTLVGQRHGGLLGLLQVALSRAANHIWFERGEMRDRQLVAARLKEHVIVRSNLPILIFPEGTCINNSAVMMFRKGSFEVTDRIYPVAIKYDPRFGDPFWNSSKQGYVQYLLMIMSAWAIKCDVWYLEPTDRLAGESSAEFANRVKAGIAKQAGLEDLAWDGQLKRSSVKPTWLFQQQEDYVRRLKLD